MKTNLSAFILGRHSNSTEMCISLYGARDSAACPLTQQTNWAPPNLPSCVLQFFPSLNKVNQTVTIRRLPYEKARFPSSFGIEGRLGAMTAKRDRHIDPPS